MSPKVYPNPQPTGADADTDWDITEIEQDRVCSTLYGRITITTVQNSCLWKTRESSICPYTAMTVLNSTLEQEIQILLGQEQDKVKIST